MNDMQVKPQSSMTVTNNKQLLDLYRANSRVGAENIEVAIPRMTIQATGKSSKNILLNGQEATDGYFYYKPTRSQTNTIDCHVLTISKGFRADGWNDRKDVFNQILAAVALVDGKKLPFIMYFTGKKLQNLWNFAEEVSMYTKSAGLPIPMFALKVRLTTKKEVSPKGSSWVVCFEILKEEDGSPVLITDPNEFVSIKNQVESIKNGIDELVAAKSTGDVLPSDEIPTNDTF